MRLLPAIVLLGIAVGAYAEPVREVRCAEIGFSKAAENRDLAEFASYIDADARFIGQIVLRGRADVTQAWSIFFNEGGPTIKWRPQVTEVLEGGDLALSRGPYRVIGVSPEGEPIEEWGTFNSVWRRDADGNWKVIFDAGNPAAGPPDDKTRAILDTEDDCP